jgi:hypothetical protein
MGHLKAVRKTRLRVVKQKLYEKSDNAMADYLADLRLRDHYTATKLTLTDLLWLIKKNKAASEERAAKNRRLRMFSVDGNIPSDFRQRPKRVVLA